MIDHQDLFVMDSDALHEDLYRMGNSSSPNFSEARGLADCLVVNRAGIQVVVANGNGFSAFHRVTAVMKARGKNIWKIKKGSPLPVGGRLVKDATSPGHFMFAPERDMPFKKFLGLLEEMATDPHISVKMTSQEVNHAG